MVLAQVMFNVNTERWKSCYPRCEYQLGDNGAGNNSRSVNYGIVLWKFLPSVSIKAFLHQLSPLIFAHTDSAILITLI